MYDYLNSLRAQAYSHCKVNVNGSYSTLQQRHKLSRVTLFFKIINNALPIFTPSHYQRIQFSTRQHHLNHFILPQVTLNAYK